MAEHELREADRRWWLSVVVGACMLLIGLTGMAWLTAQADEHNGWVLPVIVAGLWATAASPIVLAIAGLSANRIAGQAWHRWLPLLGAAIAMPLIAMPVAWFILLMAIGPCHGTGDLTPASLFIFTAAPSFVAAAGLLWMTRSVLVAAAPLVAAPLSTCASLIGYWTVNGRFVLEPLSLGVTWQVVVVLAMFAWAFSKRKHDHFERGEAAVRFQPHSGQPEEKSLSKS